MGGHFERGWLGLWSALYRLAEGEVALAAAMPAPVRAIRPDWPDGPLVGFDVGAGIGVYARAMRRSCEHVFALEPHGPQAAFLRRCGYARIEVIEAAASWQAGRAVLSDASPGRARRRPEATLEPSPGAGWSVPCETVTLDGLIPWAEARWPGFAALIKIDVEGHEGAVLTGAEALVARPHTALIVEIEPRLNRRWEATFGWLAARGYAAFQYRRGKLEPSGPTDASALIGRHGGRFAALRGYANNFVFLRAAG